MGNVPDKSLTLNKNIGPEADKMADELLKTVREIQSSNRFMLKRLNDLFHTSEGQCSCSRKQESHQQVIQELQSKISELERIVKEKDQVQKELNAQVEHLKERTDSLEISLMAVQTDDSKLHSASLRKTQAALKQEPSVTKLVKQISASSDEDKPESRENTSQVYHTKNVEYSIPATQVRDSSETRDSQGVAPDSKGSSKNKNKQDTGSTKQNTVEGSTKYSKAVAEEMEANASLPEGATGHNKSEKPNIEKATTESIQTAHQEKNSSKKPADVIEQPVRKTYGDEQFWRFLAQQELDQGKRTLKDLEGVHTVVCLDISASMAKDNAWTEAVTFVRDYLNGLEDISTKHGLTNEYVAIVTFGHETKVQKRLTNKYSEMRQLVEMQRLGGPSPIYGGLVLGLAAAGSSEHIFEVVSNVQVFTKVIIVTDGLLTEVGQYAGPDTPVENLNETKAKVIQCMEEYKKDHLDTYLVPVGKQDKETSDFIDLLLAVADGRKLKFKSGRQFSRRHYLTTKITDPFGILQTPFSLFGTDLSDFSAEDKEMIEEIKDDARKNLLLHMGRGKQNKYKEMDGGNFPPIGSRVRRGPDWKWNTQDSYGPGTVIGHDDGEQVWVEWDTDDHQNVYRYGQPGYDVLIVEEPRQLKPGQKIAVGCIVKPGKDFAQPSAKEQFWQRGVVIKLDQPKATVRWDNGERGDYSYGETGKCEIEVCTGFFAFGSEGHVLGSEVTTAPVEKKTRNKNKNVI